MGAAHRESGVSRQAGAVPGSASMQGTAHPTHVTFGKLAKHYELAHPYCSRTTKSSSIVRLASFANAVASVLVLIACCRTLLCQLHVVSAASVLVRPHTTSC